VTESPFTVLTAVVAPAILTNACSVLAMGTTNRVARVADRTRSLVAELGCRDDTGRPRAECAAELDRLRVRSRLLIRGLRAVYAALGAFAVTALFSIAGAVVAYFGPSVISAVVGVVAALSGTIAVGALVLGCTYIVVETRLALQSLQLEAQNALARAGS
jgi:hypothetical protein